MSKEKHKTKNVKCVVEICLPSAANSVANIAMALMPDNPPYVRQKAKNDSITAVVTTNDIMSLINTLEDYLVCLSLAIKVAHNVNEGTALEKN